jgi:protein-S-isoprenylcysteine O-methyltransferase Ste14
MSEDCAMSSEKFSNATNNSLDQRGVAASAPRGAAKLSATAEAPANAPAESFKDALDGPWTIGSRSAMPARRNFTIRLGELAIFLTAVIGAVALGLGISQYFVKHPYVLAYLTAYGAFRFADLLVREEAALRLDREGFGRRIVYQLPILILFAAAPFERTYVYGAEAPQWSAALGLLIELAGLWLALGARIQLGFLTPAINDGETRELVRSGMYRYIRHPIQLGEFLVLMAWPFEYGAPVTEVLMLVIGAIVTYRRIRREEVELLARHGDRYAQYMRETDRILPNVW